MKLTLSIILSLLIFTVNAQNYSLKITVKNQRPGNVYLFALKGDKQLIADTFIVNKPAKEFTPITFEFNNTSNAGMYRIILGQTRVAELMNEPPQFLDIVYNNEDIIINTYFKAPHDSLKVIKSEENRVWFGFVNAERELKKQLKDTKIDLDYYQQKNSINRAAIAAEKYNVLQRKRDSLINATIKKNSNLFAAKMIKMYREPFLYGNLTAEERTRIFKTEYFKYVDFADPDLINTPVYTEKIFAYLMSYAKNGLTRQQQENEFIKAVDVIAENTNSNSKVFNFILGYLMRGFEKLKLDSALAAVAGKYTDTGCNTNEKTTTERRILFYRQMKTGAKVPDFTLNDVNGDPVTLSEVLKTRTLLIFWAGWCPHCNLMLPQILKWYKKQNKSEVEVIAVSLDTSEKEWKEKIEELGTDSWFNVSELNGWDGKVINDYNIYATPTMFMIDKNMRITGIPNNIDELNLLK